MRGWLALALLTMGAYWKWLLAGTAVVAVTLGSLLAAGVFTGGEEKLSQTPTLVLSPTAAVTPTPTTAPRAQATPVPTRVSLAPTETLVPTRVSLAPTETPAPTVNLPQVVEVAIYAQGAQNVGSLEFVLLYEPLVLTATGVNPGTIAGNALLAFNADVPGQVRAGIIDANGITGDGPIAVVSFKVIGNSEANTFLDLTEVSAHDATTLVDIITQASHGAFRVKDGSFTAPTLIFSQ